MILSQKTRVGERLYQILEKELDEKMVGKVRDRVSVVGDLYKWKPDILDVWNIKKEREPEGFEVFWDNEFVCRFTLGEKTNDVLLKFWVGLQELVETDKVSFRLSDKLRVEELDRLRDKEVKTKLDEKEKKKAKEMFNNLTSTEEREVVAQVVSEVKQEKKKKKKIIIK